jgi:copper oxidase (laccase) domain-containing protein
LEELRGDGVQVENVEGCTMHEPLRFHSYRRDGPRSGRMLAAIVPR